ncbi:MAG: hypothetical protein ACO1SX_02920 [Actinomycetota bacterium]
MEAGKGTPQRESFADVWREIMGDRTQTAMSQVALISHTYIGQWLHARVPTRRMLTDVATRLFRHGWMTPAQWVRLFRAAGFVEPELPARPEPAPLGIRDDLPASDSQSGALLLDALLYRLSERAGQVIAYNGLIDREQITVAQAERFARDKEQELREEGLLRD